MGFLTFIMNSYSLQFACLKPDSHQGENSKKEDDVSPLLNTT